MLTSLRDRESGQLHELVDGEGPGAHELFVERGGSFGRERLTKGVRPKGEPDGTDFAYASRPTLIAMLERLCADLDFGRQVCESWETMSSLRELGSPAVATIQIECSD